MATLLVVFGLTCCTRQSSTIERVGVLPANLLISDPSSEWLKAAVPVALQYDFLTAKTFIAGVANDESGAVQAGATRVLRTSIESRNGGLHIESTMVNIKTQKVIKVESADASSASVVLPAVNALAKKFDAGAGDFSTQSTPAWQALATAEGNNNPQQRAQFLNQAITRDQNFGFAWVSLMEMIAPNRQGELKSMIDDAKSHRSSFSAYDRAKFDLVLDRLSNAAPTDQIKAAQQALNLAPNDLEVITTIGNYDILAGDFAGGEQSLRRAAALNPTNPSLRFQLARGLMEMRKLKEAETILAAIDKMPAVYPELATCVLLEGHQARSAAILEKFIATVQNDDLKTLLRAAWQVMSGNRQKGIDLVLATKFKEPNVQGLALSEASIWQLMGGDSAAAQKTVADVAKTSTQQSPLPMLISLLSDKTLSAADWEKKVQALGMPDQFKQPVLAYGFFLRGNYAQAAQAWQAVVNATHGEDLHARAMLASSLDHAGKKSEAKKIAVLPFAPEPADLYSAISFTEMRRML